MVADMHDLISCPQHMEYNSYEHFMQTPHLHDDHRLDIQRFMNTPELTEMRISLQSSNRLLRLSRHNHSDKTIVSLEDLKLGTHAGLCETSNEIASHYTWKVEKEYRGKGFGQLIRAVKEFADGTMPYEHAYNKKLALPLISWGYVPIATSTRRLEYDLQSLEEPEILLDVFERCFGDALYKPIWLAYDPQRANTFRKQLDNREIKK